MPERCRALETGFDTYRVMAKIPEGGAGTVFRGLDSDGRAVAIKRLDPAKATPRRLKRFRNELEFTRRLQHPNVVEILDHGRGNDGSSCYVMPLYDATLRVVLDGGLTRERVVALFHAMLDGVEALHLKSAIHRDLKPENMLVETNGGRLVIADFGIAHFATDDLATLIETTPADRLANFQYAAPEQRRRGATVDARADIFSLGSILNEMCTGAAVHGPGYPVVSSRMPELAYLDEVVAAMVSQDPAARPANIDALKAELRARGDLAAGYQRLDRLRGLVAAESAAEDPLMSDPIRIVGQDWADGVLKVSLSQSPSRDWIEVLTHGGARSWSINHPPETFRFVGDKVSARVEGWEAKAVLDFVRGWVANTNELYAARVRRDREQRRQEEEESIRRRILAEEERQRVLRSLS